MKKRFGRELLLLSLPVVLIGGVAWYEMRGGHLPVLPISNPLDPGPLRVEYTRFRALEMMPLDAAKGYEWGAVTRLSFAGKLDVPAGWRDGGFGNVGDVSDLRLAYRIGTQWKVAPRSSPGFAIVIGENETLKADLKTVPRQAEEIRLRGKFKAIKVYRGPAAPTWKAPANLKIKTYGLNHFVTVESQPFDVEVKGAGQLRPQIDVSRQQKIEVVEGRWLRNVFGEVMMVRFRAKPSADIERPLHCQVEEVRYFDADGKPLQVFQDAKSTVSAGIQSSMRQWVSPDLPAEQDVIRLTQSDAQPRGGWGGVKMPITVTGNVSDGQCWPTPFRVQMAPSSGEVKNYGAPG